jgi:hypothetical protein
MLSCFASPLQFKKKKKLKYQSIRSRLSCQTLFIRVRREQKISSSTEKKVEKQIEPAKPSLKKKSRITPRDQRQKHIFLLTMMTMESVDLSDVNCIAQQTLNDNTDKGPVSLEQIRIEESEERFGNLDIESATCENYHFS